MPLIDSDQWESKFLFLKQLHFHPANPRLPELRGKSSELEIIHELCQRGDVQRIAKAITEKGYFRNDRLIVFHESNKHVVYEGNRRLCALKLLHNWALAPTNFQRVFKSLSEQARLPKKIAVEIVPSKFHAEVVMYSKHVDSAFTVKWDPIQQATFIAGKLEAGETPDSISKLYGLSKEAVIDARASIDLYRLALLATLSPKAKALVDDPAKFPYSTVYERLFKPRATRELLGATIDENGLTINSTEGTFIPVLAKIMEDAAAEDINTRSLNETKAQVTYVKSLGFTPGGGKFTAAEAEARVNSAATRESPSAKHSASAKASSHSVRVSSHLLPKSLTLEYQHTKLAQLLDEAKKLEVTLAHASACLLRTILEIALNVKLKKLRVYGKIPHVSAKHGPALSEMLDYVNKNSTALGLDANTKSALEALISRAVRESKPQLDRIVHSPDVLTTTAEVIAIRETALPLLEMLLRK
jgi:hypothetical protein